MELGPAASLRVGFLNSVFTGELPVGGGNVFRLSAVAADMEGTPSNQMHLSVTGAG